MLDRGWLGGEPVAVGDAVDHGLAGGARGDGAVLPLCEALSGMQDSICGADRLVRVVDLFEQGAFAADTVG